MQVRLIAVSKPMIPECETPGDLIAYCARVSNPANQANRQNSLPCTEAELDKHWQEAQEHVWTVAQDAYQGALRIGIAKEVARVVLPEGLTRSRLYMAGSVRSWIHYVELRTDPSTQKEHRKIAEACAEILYGQFPEIATAEFM